MVISTRLTLVAALVVVSSLCTSCLASLSTKHGQSRLAVAQAPDYLKFKYDQGTLEINELNDLLQSLVGYTIHSDIKWAGLVNTQAASIPNAIMIFLGDSAHVNLDSFSSETIPIDQKNHHINLNSFDHLEDTNTAIKKFDSLSAPIAYTADCKTQKHPEIYLFKITKADSEHLAKSIDKIITDYRINCTSDLLALVLTHKAHSSTNAESVIRNKRQATNPTAVKISNEATFYSDNYPAMFNLFFWTGLLLAVSVFGVSYCMWNMDPGVDTVIYRMTSQRTKKEQ